mgnify:CR=1 FL=1
MRAATERRSNERLVQGQARLLESIAAGRPLSEVPDAIAVNEGFERAWRRVGLALDRSGFTVEDRDRAAGLYYVRYVDPKDYDKIEQQDRISVTGLNTLAPGKPVQVTIHKADGKAFTIQTNHSITEQQIAWFKAGSALNALN